MIFSGTCSGGKDVDISISTTAQIALTLGVTEVKLDGQGVTVFFATVAVTSVDHSSKTKPVVSAFL